MIQSFIARSFKYSVSICGKGSVFLNISIFLLPTLFVSLFVTVRRIVTDTSLPHPIYSSSPFPPARLQLGLLHATSSAVSETNNSVLLSFHFLKYTQFTCSVKLYWEDPLRVGLDLPLEFSQSGLNGRQIKLRNRLRKGW